MTTCPVLLLTPEIEEAFTWFRETHELTYEHGAAAWRRVALPAAGGVGDQDSRLMATLDHLKSVFNVRLAREQRKAESK